MPWPLLDGRGAIHHYIQLGSWLQLILWSFMELVPKSVLLVLLPWEPHLHRANSRIQANLEPGLRGMGSKDLVSAFVELEVHR